MNTTVTVAQLNTSIITTTNITITTMNTAA